MMRTLWAIGLLVPALRRKQEEVGEIVAAQKEKLDELLSETKGVRDAVRRAASPSDAVGPAGRKTG